MCRDKGAAESVWDLNCKLSPNKVFGGSYIKDKLIRTFVGWLRVPRPKCLNDDTVVCWHKNVVSGMNGMQKDINHGK